MWEEAPKTQVFGIQVYTFGIYCAVGVIFAVSAMLLLSRLEKFKKGTGILLCFLSILFGVLSSRVFFCLLGTFASDGVPLSMWTAISGGGWTLFGIIPGVFAAAVLTAVFTGENRGNLLDASAISLPLVIAAERFGERLFEGFDISRQLTKGGFPEGTFLGVRDSYYEDVSFMATYLLAGICAILLFLILTFFLTLPKRKTGDIWIAFLLLCGAGGILMESLRYDNFLEFHFVRCQQVMAAIMLIFGIVLAGRRNRSRKNLFRVALISLALAIALCGGIEFALDRLNINHYILYAVMTAALAVPVALGILLLRKRESAA